MTHEVNEIGFTAPAVTKERIFEFTFEGEGLTVIAFFPGAFTEVCTEEMCKFRDSLTNLNDLGAQVIGISVDTPFSLEEFRRQYGLNFMLVSDNNKEIIDKYDVRTSFKDLGYDGLAQRSLFIVKDGEIAYSQVMDDPDEMPDFEKLKEELRKLQSSQ
jgi:peroxiredoxin